MHYLIDFIRFLQQKKLSFSTQTAYNHLKKNNKTNKDFSDSKSTKKNHEQKSCTYLPWVKKRSLIQGNPQGSNNNQFKQEPQQERDNPRQQHSNYQSLHDLLGNEAMSLGSLSDF